MDPYGLQYENFPNSSYTTTLFFKSLYVYYIYTLFLKVILKETTK